jgi:ribonuclease E
MAETTSPAVTAASVPDPALVQRAEQFTRERFVHEGEDPAVALAPGSSRRRALDMAVVELEAGATVPSTKWRRRYSLLLGLERVLSEDEPKLADGTQLNPHQVDALSGTLVALLASTQRVEDVEIRRGAAPVLAVDEDESEVQEPVADDEPDEPDEPDEDRDDDDEDDDEPVDFDDDDDEDDDDGRAPGPTG